MPDAPTAPAFPGALSFRTVTFQTETNSNGLAENEFEGHAAVFNTLDSYYTVFAPGCFVNTLERFRQRGAITWQHNWDQPIGKPVEAREDHMGLYIRGRISDVEKGREALTLMRDDVINSLSFGFFPVRSHDMDEEEGAAMFGLETYLRYMANLPWWADAIEVFDEVGLYEVSPVTVPANDGATITGVRDASSLAGLTLGDHSEAALAVVRGWSERMQSFAGLKVREGRVLSEANRTRLVSMRDSLTDHCQMLNDLLAATEPKETDAERAAAEAETQRRADARHLYAEYLRSEAEARGVALA